MDNLKRYLMKLRCICILMFLIVSCVKSQARDHVAPPISNDEPTLLDDSGQIMVEDSSNSYQLFEPAKVRFRRVIYDTPSTAQKRLSKFLTIVQNSEVLELPMPDGKQYVGNWRAIRLRNGNILVYGRRWQVENPYFAIWIFETKLKKAAQALKVASIYDSELTLLNDGRVLITGGRDKNKKLSDRSDIFDPDKSAILSCGRLLIPRFHHSAVQLKNGKVVVAGGKTVDFATDPKQVLDSVEVLDLETKASRAGPKLTNELYDPILIPSDRAKVEIVGGWHVRHNLSGDLRWVRVSQTIDTEQKSQ